MESGPLSTEEFSAFSRKVVLFCFIASKVKGEPFPDLMVEKGGLGFPHVCFLDASGQVVAQQEYTRMFEDGVAAFERTLVHGVQSFYELQKAAQTGEANAKAAFFMRRFELGHLGADALERAVGKTSILSKEQQAEVRFRLIELRTAELLRGIDLERPAGFGPFADKLLRQRKSLGLPEGPSGITAWYVILEDAYRRRDAKTFEMSFIAIRAAGMRSASFVAERQKQLEELKRTKKKQE